MSKLQDLIRNLKSYSVIIIDDDITLETDATKLVGKFCRSSNRIKSSLLQNLEAVNENNISEALKDFDKEFSPLLELAKIEDGLLPENNLHHFLEKAGREDLKQHDIFDTIAQKLGGHENYNSIEVIFLKFGIYSGVLSNYSQVLIDLKGVEECDLLFFKSDPSEAEKEDFYKDIKISIDRTQSNFCLAIVDKALGTGDGEQAGKVFINELVENFRDDTKFRFACCIFTSRSNSVATPLNTFQDYFVQEVSKASSDVTDEIAKNLAQSAYAEVFNSLRQKKEISARHALEVVLKNQKNIKYIIDQAHVEGVTPYESIKYWFDLALQKQFEKDEIESFNFNAGLSSFFNQEYLTDHPLPHEIGSELRELNTFELFDYNVNRKHLPIAPGDIWESNGQYYILVGQLCDLLLRRGTDNTPDKRKAKVGELLRIKILDNQDLKGKYQIISEENKNIIYIEHFLVDQHSKVLRIDISTPFINFADLEVLDLSMFNESGECELLLDQELSDITKLVLPGRKDKYYEILRSQYRNLGLKNIRLLAGHLDLGSPLDFSKLKFTEVGNKITHGIRRVCRLKGRYFDSLYNNYLNSKGRIDLYLTDNSQEIAHGVRLIYQLATDESTRSESNINIYRRRNGAFLRKEELKEAIQSPFNALLSAHSADEIDIHKTSPFFIVAETDGHVSVKLCYQDQNGRPFAIDKTEFGFKELFRDNKNRYENKSFSVLGQDDPAKVFKDSSVTVVELTIGIVIPELKEKVRFVNGVLTIESFEE